MQTYINGEAHTLHDNTTVEALVESLRLDTRKIAIEVNLCIVPRSLYGETRLCDGDKIEVVQFIGGG